MRGLLPAIGAVLRFCFFGHGSLTSFVIYSSQGGGDYRDKAAVMMVMMMVILTEFLTGLLHAEE
jgi:hypothetical protein